MIHKARRRFGQNFLHDPGVVSRIISVINPKPNDRLVEIGPGQGAITKDLLRKAGRLDVIELDRDLIEPLQMACEPLGELVIHSADALKFDFRALFNRDDHKLRIVGNLPYNISTPILFRLLEQAEVIEDMHFMLQKEVVQRMAAVPGSKVYGRLSIMLQIRCNVTPLFDIGPGAFQPPPKVDSTLVRLQPRQQLALPQQDLDSLKRVVTQAFSQRRKTLRKSLKGLLSTETIQAAGIDPAQRPEQLSLEEFAALAKAIETT